MRREAPCEVDIKHSLHRLTVDYGLFSNSRFYKIFNYILYVLKEERLKRSTLKKWRLLGIVLVALVVGVVGCPETQQMMKPAVSEPADTPPAMVGDMKKPEETPAEEPKAEEPEETPATEQPTEEKSAEPEPPADTTLPMVVEVVWYGDQELTKILTAASKVRPGDTVYTMIKFSELMAHTVADDNTARPALFAVIDGKTKRYRMLPSGTILQSGEAKSLGGNKAKYLCRYTIRANETGTIALRVGSVTVSTAGNRVAEASVHTAPFMVMEPVVAEPIPPPQPPEFPQRELTPQEKAEEIVREIIRLQDERPTNGNWQLEKEVLERESGLTFVFIWGTLYQEIYLEERPEEKDDPFSWYDLVLEYLRLSFLYPDASEEELLAHFRQSVKDGRVEVSLAKSAFIQKRRDDNKRLREGIPAVRAIRTAIKEREIAALKQRQADPSFDIVTEYDTIFMEEAGLSFDFVHNTLMGIYLQENPDDQKILDAGIYHYSFLISRYLLHKRTYEEESEEQILERIREDVARNGSVYIKLSTPLEEY